MGQIDVERGATSKGETGGKRMPKPAKILIGVTAGAVALAAVAYAAFFAYIRITYADFYGKAKAEFETPALNTDFVPQDIAYSKAEDAWFLSGYDSNEKPSPIWRINSDGSQTHISVIEPNGDVYHGHGGGFTMSDKYAYLTCDKGYLVIPAKEVLQHGNDINVSAIAKIDVGFDPAFINLQDGVLYTGVFYYEGPYSTPEKMHLTSPDGTLNHAVMYAYSVSDDAEYGISERPFAVYSIPDKVQGVALLPSNQMMFSTSWGIGESTLPVYSLDDLSADGKYNVDGEDVDLFFMDGRNIVSRLTAPPMMEGIIFHDGKVWLSNESACNKYFFGKLYGGGTIFSIPG